MADSHVDLHFGRVSNSTSPVVSCDTATWPGLTKLLTSHQTSAAKDGAGWVPGPIQPGPRVSARVARWDVLALDVEAHAEGKDPPRVVGPLPPTVEEIATEIELRGWSAAIATSHRHEAPAEGGTLGPRYRIVFELSRPLAPAEIKPLGLVVVRLLGVADCFDKKCLEPSRLFYLPRVPRERSHLARSAVVQGDPLDVDALLRAAQMAHNAPRRSSPPAGASVIDAFNAQADWSQILERHGYESRGRGRWVWSGSTSGLPGVVLLPDSNRVYSHHEHDPLASQHSHDPFSAWCVLEHAGDYRAAVRTAAQMLGMDARQDQPAAAPPTANGAPPAAPAAVPFEVVPIADLAHSVPPAPLFAWEGIVPLEHVTLLGAHGGAGKSMLMLMLAVCTALGRPLFNIPTRQGKVAFFSAEDGANLLRHRLHIVCRCMGVRIQDLEGKLFLLDAAEQDPTLFAEVAAAGRREGRTTPAYDALREFLRARSISLLIVDNASDVFDANEIERAKVRAFIRSLARLAREGKAAVILLAHVDKGTSRQERTSTEGYSGSTAWHNSARSRLFMRTESDGALVLEHQKNNLGPKHAPLRLIWPADSIPQLDEAFGPVVQGIADRAHERELLRLIAEYSERGEHITTATTSRTHAAKVLRQEPGFPQRLKDAEVFDLLRKAERSGYLARVTYRGADRKPRECWEVTAAGMAFARRAATAATAATSDVTAPTAEPAEPAATAATSPPGGMGGKARTEVAAAEGASA